MNETFLTKEVKVTANPEIVKLMMEPLYGDDPTYGVRELLQNAVDACLEREQWEKNHGNPNYKGLVDIRIENGTFTIIDNGMGMNETVLLNYYLSAGASYRSSEAWMAANAPDGKSQVARTGKFGVGFLASFLLGDEVEVHTQHREDKKGYQFKFDQESRPLDIQREDRTNPYAAEVSDPTHAGTTITIKLKATAIRGFYSNNYNYPWYNWYAFDEPKVRYFIDGKELHHEGLRHHREHTKNEGWLSMPSEDFETVQWNPNMKSTAPVFYCNGIRVYDGIPVDLEKFGLATPIPHISVIDKKGILDVTLSRNSLRTLPLKQELYRELYRWHIARLLLTPWDTEEACRINLILGFLLRSTDTYGRIPFLMSSGGFSLNCAAVLPALCPKGYVILYYEGLNVQASIQNAQRFLFDVPFSIMSADVTNLWDPADYMSHNYGYYSPGYFVGNLLSGITTLYREEAISYDLREYFASVWLQNNALQSYRESTSQPLLLTEDNCLNSITVCHTLSSRSVLSIHPNDFPINEFPVVFHVAPDYRNLVFHKYADSLFFRTLEEILGTDLWIPFNMEERKKKFPKAFEELKVYMDHIRKSPVE